jgi:hypothetical protein
MEGGKQQQEEDRKLTFAGLSKWGEVEDEVEDEDEDEDEEEDEARKEADKGRIIFKKRRR